MTAQPFAIRPFVSLPIASRAEFWTRYLTDDMDNGGLFLPGITHWQEGETVDVEVGFLEERVAFQAQAVVRGPVAAAGRDGTRVEFLSNAVKSRDFILQFVGGERPASRQLHRRYPVEMRAEVVDGATTLSGITINLSLGGVQVDVGKAINVSQQVRVRLRPTELSVLEIGGKVVWSSPKKCGIEFEFSSPSEEHLLGGLLELARERVVVVF